MSRATDIIREIAAAHRLRPADLVARDRRPHVCIARHEAMWRMRQLHNGSRESPWSFPAIARHFNRDHTTVMAGVRAHEARLSEERMAA